MAWATTRLGATGAMLALAVGCGPAPGNVEAPRAMDETASRVARFKSVEDDVLHTLAAIDRRVARRAHLEPREEDLRHLTMGAVLAEDASLAVVDGAIDPFSFEARARGLAAVKATLATAPAELPLASGPLAAPALERELLLRLVDEEVVRLEEERALPRSASSLVRAVVETWQAPASQQHAAERDRWLSRRLHEVSASISGGAAPGTGALDVVRARELDDALDALEHDAESGGLVRATAELVKLRELLEGLATRPAVAASSDWTSVGRRLRVHLGLALAPDVLERRLDAAERALRSAATRAADGAHLDPDALAAHAALLVFAGGPCAVAVPGSRVRSMAPSPERAVGCRLRQGMLSATDETMRAYMLVAMHDHVVVAQWALDAARGTATIAQATGKHRPLSRPGPDVAARWERIALARPVAAIGGGLAADVLFGAGDPGARARVWSELGEVPLDIAERELQLRAADAPTKK